MPDAGSYLGSGDSYHYAGSLSSPLSVPILLDAVAGTASQTLVPNFLADYLDGLNSIADADAEVQSYLSNLVSSNVSADVALQQLVDDIQADNADTAPAARVLSTLLPVWLQKLSGHTREQLSNAEQIVVGIALYQVNQRRALLVETAKSKLKKFRDKQSNCLSFHCLFAVQGFPSVIDDTVQEVDTDWLLAAATGLGAGGGATAALAAAVLTVEAAAVHVIFPHAASITLGATAGSLIALPATVIAIAAVSTYMAIDNLIQAQKNEDAYDEFIESNSSRFTDLDAFLGHDYSEDRKISGELVVAAQKMSLDLF